MHAHARSCTQTGQLLLEKQVHEGDIQDLQVSPCGSHFITASLDKSAKLIDVADFETLKTYKTGRFVQSAAISPLMDHVSAFFFLLDLCPCVLSVSPL